MKKWTDDEIQSFLDDKMLKNNATPDDDAPLDDILLYQQLFDIVATKPNATLPMNFSKKVVEKIEYKQNRVGNVIFYCLIGVLSLLGIILAVSIINYEFLSELLLSILKYKGIITFCIGSFWIIQYFDKRFVRVME